jgi:hypothetical protein
MPFVTAEALTSTAPPLLDRDRRSKLLDSIRFSDAISFFN